MMTMKRIYVIGFVLSLAFLQSCGSKDKHINFGYLECFNPGINEKQLSISQLHLNFYEKYLFIDSCDIMLNRVILSDSNYFYIAMSTNSTIEKFENRMLRNNAFKVLNQKQFEDKEKKFNSFLIKNKDMFFNRILYTAPKTKEFIVFDYVSKDSLTANSFYENQQNFTQKISCNDE